ncbi:MAG: hypothetical protein JST79_20850 [Acidobacteria bacterium]|jgi:hypothetical protein|nr:hypothetical protein [Acidobacteriota bacterium]
MKSILFAACLFCAASAFGQVGTFVPGGLSNQPVLANLPTSHPERAQARAMGEWQNLLESSSNRSAKGERPLWEFATPAETPLGDVARDFRKQRLTAKKAEIVWSN